MNETEFETWQELINLSYMPMSMASLAGLLASVFLGRWQAVAGRLRKLHDERLNLLREADISGQTEVREALYSILDCDAKRALQELHVIRSANVLFSFSVILCLLSSCFNGLSVFSPVLGLIARPLVLFVAALIIIGLFFGAVEAFGVVGTQTKREQAVYALEKYGIQTSDDTTETLKVLIRSVHDEFELKSFKWHKFIRNSMEEQSREQKKKKHSQNPFGKSFKKKKTNQSDCHPVPGAHSKSAQPPSDMSHDSEKPQSQDKDEPSASKTHQNDNESSSSIVSESKN